RRLGRDALLVDGGGLGVAVQLRERRAEVFERVRVFRVELCRALQGRERVGVLSEREEREAEVVVRLGVFGLELDGLLQGADCVGEALHVNGAFGLRVERLGGDYRPGASDRRRPRRGGRGRGRRRARVRAPRRGDALDLDPFAPRLVRLRVRRVNEDARAARQVALLC